MDTYNRFIKTDGLGNNDAVTIRMKEKKNVCQSTQLEQKCETMINRADNLDCINAAKKGKKNKVSLTFIQINRKVNWNDVFYKWL